MEPASNASPPQKSSRNLREMFPRNLGLFSRTRNRIVIGAAAHRCSSTHRFVHRALRP